MKAVVNKQPSNTKETFGNDKNAKENIAVPKVTVTRIHQPGKTVPAGKSK